MTQKAKFDPSRVASLLETGAKEGGALLGERTARVTPNGPALPTNMPDARTLTTPQPSEQPRASTPAATADLAADSQLTDTTIRRPITVRLSEEVLHALVRHQAEVRCKPGARLGETTIGGVMDTLLRGPLGLA